MYNRISAQLGRQTREYLRHGPTIGDVGALAAGIRDGLAAARGIAAEEPVCLCLEERHHLLAALLASLAGGPPLILPHAFDPPVLREIRETQPYRLILTDRWIDPPPGAEAIAMKAFHPADRPLPLLRPPQEPFLSLFTGGSTAKPRMWQKTAANLFGEAIHLAKIFAVGDGDLIVSTAPPQHIYGLLGSVLLPFVSGARVLPRTCAFPREITAAIEEEKPTLLVSVPIHYRALKNSALGRHSLRLALSSAAPLESEDGAFFLARTGLRITEIYGSTETGGMATRRFGMDNGLWEPFTCLAWRTLSDRLCVRSPFVSPDLPRDGEGFYVTADRVAAAEANRFMFLGRSDRIVKIGGKRVDLDEIREKIRRIPGVSDAYVAAVPGKGTGRLEIAALVAGSGPARALAAAIRSLEIPYGRPRRVRIVKAIPVCGNGKIDREAIEKLLSAPHRPPAGAALTAATPPPSPREP